MANDLDQSDPSSDEQLRPNVSPTSFLLIGLALFSISILGIEFTRSSHSIATLWPSNAILLVVILRHAQTLRSCGLLVLSGGTAMGLANLVAGNSPALSLALALANVAEVTVAWALLTRFQNGVANFSKLRPLLAFILIASGIAPIASATIGATAIAAAHPVSWTQVWLSWYTSDALGMIIVAPLLLSVTSRDWRTLRINERIGEAAVVLGVIIVVTIFAAYYRPFLFVVALAILLAILRFRFVGAAVGTFTVAVITTAFIVYGIGSVVLVQSAWSERIFALQVFLATVALWSLPVSTVLAERDQLLSKLRLANSALLIDNERKSVIVSGLSRRLSIAEEAERLRLSHELHDQTGQSLAAAILDLKQIEQLVDGPAYDRLKSLRKQIVLVGETIHRVAWELRPPSLDELGLTNALASYVADWSAQHGIEADFHCTERTIDDLPEEICTAIYRVIQEALTNIAKHARTARNVSVVIERGDPGLRVMIEDNGCGFESNPASRTNGSGKAGLGIAGMRERLSLLGGEIEIESAPGTGTTIFAKIPLQQAEARS
jgi:signal transduction histidine kinase